MAARVLAKKHSPPSKKLSQTARLVAAVEAIGSRLEVLERRDPAVPSVVLSAPQSFVPAQEDVSWDAVPAIVEEICPKEGELLWASDIHFPYQHKPSCDLVLKYAQDRKPKIGVLGGDIYDFFSLSDFDRDPSRATHRLQREFDAGRSFVEEFCKHCTDVFFLVGNHEFRGYKTLCDLPGLYGLRALEFKKIAELPAKVKVFPYLTLVKVGNLHLTHGTIANRNTAKSTHEKFGRSIIVGHDHGAKTHIHVDLLTQSSQSAMVAGTLSDVRQAQWAKHPRWTNSFITADLWTDAIGNACFNAHHRIPVNGTLGANGKVYRV